MYPLQHAFSQMFCRLVSPLYYDLTVKIPDFPKWMHLESTSHCNANCYFCPRHILTRGKGFMDVKLFERAVDEIGVYGVNRLTLHLMGEPLLHPEIFEMVKYAKTKEKIRRVEFSSNGALLTEKRIQQVIDSGLDWIMVDMDGATAATYENARRGLKFDVTVQNLKNLIEAVHASERQRPYIRLQAVQTPAVAAEMDRFWEIWKPVIEGKSCVEVHLKKYEWWSGAKPEDAYENSNWGKPGPLYARLPCGMLERQMNVFWNGEVNHCCLDANGDLKIGDFRERSLYEIWHGEASRKLKSLVRDGSYARIKPCDGCIRSSAKRFFSFGDMQSFKGLFNKLSHLFPRPARSSQ